MPKNTRSKSSADQSGSDAFWWEKQSQIARRKFEFEIDLGPWSNAAREVLACLEKTDLEIFEAKNRDALCRTFDGDIWDLLAGATEKIDIREWLAIGCQFIKFDQLEAPAVGLYSCNAPKVIFPQDHPYKPAGPAALVCEISIDRCFQSFDTVSCDALKHVIAHELVHAFDIMRFIVPAVADWNNFWKNALREGSFNDEALVVYTELSNFMDLHYGEQHELDAIKAFWPSHAEKWFDAFRNWQKKRIAKRNSPHPG